jgi:hypothetical protein
MKKEMKKSAPVASKAASAKAQKGAMMIKPGKNMPKSKKNC